MAKKAAAFRSYAASDYAGLEVETRRYYYGYEFDQSPDGHEIWGFAYTREGEPLFRITYEAMAEYLGCPDQFETRECLLFGLGLAMAQGVVS
jgi:hypothetical protein